MIREWDMNQVSNGKLYTENDMVKLGCNECQGCSKCCHDMGESIILDPLDVFRITCGVGKSFQQLLSKEVELNVVDGLILPNIKMGDDNNCPFLDKNGRCSIHSYRAGICRLFPLGRIYENEDFKYFNQIHECPKEGRTKIKISKWLDVQDIKEYHNFICAWHYFTKKIGDVLISMDNEEQSKTISMYIINLFYINPYSSGDNFYKEFYERIDKVKSVL